MSWNARRKGWLNRGEPPMPQRELSPEPVEDVHLPATVYLPGFPVFSPASFAALVCANRSTVATWIADGKLEIYRDNLNEPYILRREVQRFVLEYLRRKIIET